MKRTVPGGAWLVPSIRLRRAARNAFASGLAASALFASGCASTPPASPIADFRDRVCYGRRLEPTGNAVLHGAGQSTTAFANYVNAVGRNHTPALFMTYINLTQSEESIRIHLARLDEERMEHDGTVIPQIGIGLRWGGRSLTAEFASGAYDKQIDAFARALKQRNRPAFVRIGFECNGRWNHYEPQSYVAAFRHVATRIRALCPSQVAIVWCYASDVRNLDNMMDWYPGDEWVDWWGIDLFSVEHFTNPDTPTFMRLAREHRFPVMICESSARYVGVLKGSESWNEWFVPFFDFIAGNENVKAFCYINWDWGLHPEWKDWGDCRIERNRPLQGLYRRALNHPFFVHATDTEALRQLPDPPPAAPAPGN